LEGRRIADRTTAIFEDDREAIHPAAISIAGISAVVVEIAIDL
jgi:hypothetical protein